MDEGLSPECETAADVEDSGVNHVVEGERGAQEKAASRKERRKFRAAKRRRSGR